MCNFLHESTKAGEKAPHLTPQYPPLCLALPSLVLLLQPPPPTAKGCLVTIFCVTVLFSNINKSQLLLMIVMSFNTSYKLFRSFVSWYLHCDYIFLYIHSCTLYILLPSNCIYLGRSVFHSFFFNTSLNNVKKQFKFRG